MRQIPLIVVASASAGIADSVAARLRQEGAVAYATHSAEGCLRVATSVRPDVVMLDAALPSRLLQLLRAHPVSAQATVMALADAPRLSAAAHEKPVQRTHLSAA
jgi:DNA-binding response OmpR family regulator